MKALLTPSKIDPNPTKLSQSSSMLHSMVIPQSCARSSAKRMKFDGVIRGLGD